MAKRSNPQEAITGMTTKQIRAEYSRLRSIANKRIGRLEAKGYKTAPAFPKIVNAGDIAMALVDVQRFIGSPTSRIGGYEKYQRGREKAAKTLGKSMGLNLTVKDVRKVGAFMDALRNKYGSMQVTSDVAMEVFKFGQKNKIPMNVLRAHYNEFKNNLTEFNALSRKYETQYKSGGGGEDYLSRLEKLKGMEGL